MAICATIISSNQSLFDLLIERGFDLEEEIDASSGILRNKIVCLDGKSYKYWYPLLAAISQFDTNPHYLTVLLKKQVNFSKTVCKFKDDSSYLLPLKWALDHEYFSAIPTLLLHGVPFTPDDVNAILATKDSQLLGVLVTVLKPSDITDSLVATFIINGMADLAMTLVRTKCAIPVPMKTVPAIAHCTHMTQSGIPVRVEDTPRNIVNNSPRDDMVPLESIIDQPADIASADSEVVHCENVD